MQAGKLPWTSLKKRDPQLHSTKNSRLKEAVAACQDGKMSQAVASITYQVLIFFFSFLISFIHNFYISFSLFPKVPKTTIWRRLQRGLQQSSDATVKSVRSVEVTNAGVDNPSGTLPEQGQFSFIEV